MQYYYVMCERESSVYRAYVRLDSESADILHDHLEATSTVCQVCPVDKSQVEPDFLID
jgi:uncharacterized metal-binding protein